MLTPTQRSAMTALCLTLAAAPALAAEPAGQAQKLTLEEAVKEALARNPRLRGARALSHARTDQARSMRGHLLPLVDVSGLYSDLNSPEKLNIAGLLGPILPHGGGGGAPPAPFPLQGVTAGIGMVTVAQPLVGLLHLGQDFAAATDHADASDEIVRAAEADLREQVESGFLSLFEARALQGIAKASLDQLADQLTLTEAKFRDGVLTRADVLRIKVAVANADQQRIQAQVQERIARASLLTLLAYPPDSQEIDFAEPTDLERRTVPAESTQAQAFALSHRPEIHSAALEQSAAHHSWLSSEFKLLPEVNASAMYLRLQGVPPGIPQDFYVLGVNLDWPIWQWGASYYQSRAASEQDDAARFQVESLREQVSLEVDQRIAEEGAAANAVTVARDAISQAEEAYRVTDSMVKAGAATTTDLLDAQAALAQARLNLVRASYQDLRARSALTRAMGG